MFDSRLFYTSHCKSRSQWRAAVCNTTKSPLQLCKGHLLAMWGVVWLAAPHSHDADGDSPIWFMLYLNLPYPVRIWLRRTSECRVRSCPTSFFLNLYRWINALDNKLTIGNWKYEEDRTIWLTVEKIGVGMSLSFTCVYLGITCQDPNYYYIHCRWQSCGSRRFHSQILY